MLYAGRADQLISLVQAIDKKGDCSAKAKSAKITIVCGPGALVALADGALNLANYPWLKMRFYSLRDRPREHIDPLYLAADSDKATGYAALLRAYTRLTHSSLANENTIPVHIDPQDGHNIQTTTYICPSSGDWSSCDDAGYPGVVLRPKPGRYRVEPPVHLIRWEVDNFTVNCRPSKEVTVDGEPWIGITDQDGNHGYQPRIYAVGIKDNVLARLPPCQGNDSDFSK
jgi:hypothetical protein